MAQLVGHGGGIRLGEDGTEAADTISAEPVGTVTSTLRRK